MINLSMPTVEGELKPRITVFGVGGAGGNAINNMIKSNLEGVDFVVSNTDAQALKGSLAQKKLQLGTTITRGLGAGSRPDIGRAAAEEQIDEIMTHLDGANMVFITAGMGGGTGTGAAPVIARAARERGILTVGVVTKPFHFEGAHRMTLAETGIGELQQYVDTLIIIPNQNLFRIANEKTTFADAFKMADDVLHAGVRGVTDLMVMPGLINLDFADIRSVMTEMGKAMMGTGEATGDRRAVEAAEAAISNPLLDDVSMKGARGVLINITGGYDMTLFEVDEAANRIRDEVDPEANIIFGSTFDTEMDGRMRVSVVATGIDGQAGVRPVAAAAAAAGAAGAAAAGRGKGNGAAGQVDYHATLVAAAASGATGTAGAAPAAAVAAGPAESVSLDALAGARPAAPASDGAAAAGQGGGAAGFEPALAKAKPGDDGGRPAAPARGDRSGGYFIAPRPAVPDARKAAVASASAGPARNRGEGASSGASGAATGAEAEGSARQRGGTFLDWVGLGGGRRTVREAPEVPQPERVQATVRPTPQLKTVAVASPVRSGPGPREAVKLSPANEEMLEIPAFLRRQAN